MKKLIKFISVMIMAAASLLAVFFAVSPAKSYAHAAYPGVNQAHGAEYSGVNQAHGAEYSAYDYNQKPAKRGKGKRDFKLPDGIKNVISVKPFMLDGEKPALAVLTGEGETFVQNVRIYVCSDARILYELKAEDGYSPDIGFFEFEKGKRFLFYSSQTGGSGGYGNYAVYKLVKSGETLLYSSATDEASFDGEFTDGGKMVLKNNASGNALTVDVGYMSRDFYSKIFSEKGKPTGEAVNVNPVSTVFPFYNGASETFSLITYRSVTAVAEVNRLGYIEQTLNYDGATFSPSFTQFSIEF